MPRQSRVVRATVVIAFIGMIFLPWGAGDVASPRATAMGPHGGVPVLPAPVDCEPKDPPPPVVKVKVRVPACAAPGRPIEYHLCVENCSTAEAHHVVLKNPLPANAKFVKADPEPTRLLPELQWHLGTIGGGATREVRLVLQPTDGDDVKNCTRVQFEHGQCVTTRLAGYANIVPGPIMPPPDTGTPGVPPQIPGQTGEPPQAPPKVVAEKLPKLNLTIDGHKRQYVNLASHYFLTVRNTGATAARNLVVSAALPAKTTFVRAGDGGKELAGQVAWVLTALAPGAEETVELVLKATEEGEYCVKAEVRADLGVTGRAEACTRFVGVSALLVEMVDRDDPIDVGGKTSYPILIKSQGSAAVTNVRLRAFIPSELDLTLVKGPTYYQNGEKTPRGRWIEFAPVPRLDAKGDLNYEIFVDARRPGEVRFRVEVGADQLERGPVVEEESTTIIGDAAAPKIKPLSWTRSIVSR
jgi:uncharacterized repeat protein (TIGR01451 family)